MKVLIIGNGFDIAHGLPTKYTDFLEYTENFLNYSAIMDSKSCKGEELYNGLHQNMLLTEFSVLIEGNAWLRYFVYKRKEGLLKGETWIDFEQEIGAVVSKLESAFINFDDSHYRYSNKNALSGIFRTFGSFTSFRDSNHCEQVFFTKEFEEWLPGKQAQDLINTNNRLIDCYSEFLFLQLKACH